jgi:hypothetical protein
MGKTPHKEPDIDYLSQFKSLEDPRQQSKVRYPRRISQEND